MSCASEIFAAGKDFLRASLSNTKLVMVSTLVIFLVGPLKVALISIN